MASYNKIIMMGNLTRDPQMNGPFCKFGIASTKKYRKDDQLQEETCFIDVDVFGKQTETCMKFLKKGMNVMIEGRLVLNSWKDKDGQDKTKMVIKAENVTFTEWPDREEKNEQQEQQPKQFSQQQAFGSKPAYNKAKLPF